jgi:hypothetical protein
MQVRYTDVPEKLPPQQGDTVSMSERSFSTVLSQGSDQSQPTSLDLIFISVLPGFGLHEAIFTFHVFTRTELSLLSLRGRPSPLQM